MTLTLLPIIIDPFSLSRAAVANLRSQTTLFLCREGNEGHSSALLRDDMSHDFEVDNLTERCKLGIQLLVIDLVVEISDKQLSVFETDVHL